MADDMNAREYSTHAREPRDAGRVARVMAEAARLAGDGRGRFLAPALLQSWPGIVHGGGLVALLGAAACSLAPRPAGPLRLEGRLTSSVPIETALDLEGHAEDGVATVTILEGAQPLASASVEPVAATGDVVPPQWSADGRAGFRMPLSDQCLACGADNPLGLRLGLAFDDDGVWARFEPPAPWRTPDGTMEPALAPVILDEVAWWLGALVTREGGLTNRLAVTLLRPAHAAPGPVTAVGRFADVAPVDRRRTFWRTRAGLLAADGSALAVASIVFRPGPEYSARQMPFFRARTDPAVFGRMFPGYAG
jgi:hypothetical protein